MAFVVDNSVVMAWCFEDETNPYTEAALDRLLGEEAIVPLVWPLEVANVLLVAGRRQRLTEADTLRFVQFLLALPIVVDNEALTSAFGPVPAIGRETGLSAYDAAYLELAARLGLSLATQDKRLKAAAAQLGVLLVA